MNVNKATGPDGIAVCVLKEFANELSPILSKIFCLSYKQGKHPNASKNAMVQPVLKRGCDKIDPSNYRPISIVSAVAKVFEKCVNQHGEAFAIALNISKAFDNV